MDDKATKRGGGAVAVVVLVLLVILPLLYVLSVGPAIRVHSAAWTGDSADSVIEAVYAPLSRVANRFPLFDPVVDWYVALWLP